MNKYIAILLLTFSGSAFAETYLCTAEAGAGVSFDKKTSSFDSRVYNVSSEEFVLSNNSGKWVVKRFGQEKVWLPCQTEFVCERQDGSYAGHFIKYDNSNFTAMWFVTHSDTDVSEDVTMRGRCSKIPQNKSNPSRYRHHWPG